MILCENEPITVVGNAALDPADLNSALSAAPILVAADGGADHLLQADLIPAAVIGDLDSLSDRAREMFADRLHKIDEQDTTDFEKVILQTQAPAIVGVGFLGGRLDHTIAALNVLTRHVDRKIILIGEGAAVFALRDQSVTLEVGSGAAVSVLPMERSVVSSKGLVWEMDALELDMSGTISSSNRTDADVVQIDVKGCVIVTVPKAALSEVITAVRGE